MSTFNATLEIAPLNGDVGAGVSAMVDTGSTLSKVPRDLLESLDMQPQETRDFMIANNQVIRRDVGYAFVSIEGRRAPDLIIFGEPGETPLIGARTLEGLFLAVDPINERLIPMPGYDLSERP